MNDTSKAKELDKQIATLDKEYEKLDQRNKEIEKEVWKLERKKLLKLVGKTFRYKFNSSSLNKPWWLYMQITEITAQCTIICQEISIFPDNRIEIAAPTYYYMSIPEGFKPCSLKQWNKNLDRAFITLDNFRTSGIRKRNKAPVVLADIVAVEFGGDWYGVYMQGELIYEGHSLDLLQVLDTLDISYEYRIADDSLDNLPQNISELQYENPT